MKSLGVLIIDDSALIRRSLTHILKAHPDIEVVGTASDGLLGLEKISALKPDVVLLDIHMPRMDGLQVLQQVMKTQPLPIIMFSSVVTSEAEITLQALRLGAVDFLAKPKGSLTENLRYLSRELVAKVKAAKEAKLLDGGNHRRFPLGNGKADEDQPASSLPSRPKFSVSDDQSFIVIGCSTGGPKVLEEIIPALPPDFPAAIGIVQHMPEPFSSVFTKNLDQMSAVKVKIAAHGEPFRSGQILMAPGDANLRVVSRDGTVIALLERLPEKGLGCMPSVDALFSSAARTMADKTLGILLTGMGRDGVKGMAAIKIMGGTTIAQDESSSIVFGMPRAAIESGTVDKVLPSRQIPDLLVDYLKIKR